MNNPIPIEYTIMSNLRRLKFNNMCVTAGNILPLFKLILSQKVQNDLDVKFQMQR